VVFAIRASNDRSHHMAQPPVVCLVFQDGKRWNMTNPSSSRDEAFPPWTTVARGARRAITASPIDAESHGKRGDPPSTPINRHR